eukprot:TRINITY_DN5703_c0_g1_i2.p1 TRINITY_DN5703_c0_g1~~TRINITY_DN5703_c0_g1_i2.p1  ORF type:complete len:315 (-),score=33.39 TRINITY_DN5703_c0_g1_i2:773-1639(-)
MAPRSPIIIAYRSATIYVNEISMLSSVLAHIDASDDDRNLRYGRMAGADSHRSLPSTAVSSAPSSIADSAVQKFDIFDVKVDASSQASCSSSDVGLQVGLPWPCSDASSQTDIDVQTCDASSQCAFAASSQTDIDVQTCDTSSQCAFACTEASCQTHTSGEVFTVADVVTMLDEKLKDLMPASHLQESIDKLNSQLDAVSAERDELEKALSSIDLQALSTRLELIEQQKVVPRISSWADASDGPQNRPDEVNAVVAPADQDCASVVADCEANLIKYKKDKHKNKKGIS